MRVALAEKGGYSEIPAGKVLLIPEVPALPARRTQGNDVKSIFVGNLDVATTREELWELFAAYGKVEHVNIIKDRETGLARGFAFVEMTKYPFRTTSQGCRLRMWAVDGQINESKLALPFPPRLGGCHLRALASPGRNFDRCNAIQHHERLP
jgi:hypothetical protein